MTYRWYAQVAEQGDAIDDPSIAWPDARRLVELGSIEIKRMATEKDAVDKEALFMPTNVPDGIELLIRCF